MKPYFAKYLPVEGEIKKGDKLIDPTMSSLGVVEALTDNEGRRILEKGGKRVKLYLCSRDIQKGDEFFDDRDLTKESLVHTSTQRKIWEKKGVITKHFFKVIGEISPDALEYVKEGDEFNEIEISEIMYKSNKGEQIPTHWYNKLLKTDPQRCKEFTPVVKIKGPCGHFH